jgi:hypothetical protein
MRLRLIVRRNCVPDVKLLWNVVDEDCTIFQLLSQINDVIVIESGEWGLEDYAVEYTDGVSRGFECLHFQVVFHILKNDDQILFVTHTRPPIYSIYANWFQLEFALYPPMT